jgi:hypothetical protein
MALAIAPAPATATQRPYIARSARCSKYVSDCAARLFLDGWAPRMRFMGSEDGHPYWSVSSETSRRVCTIDYDVHADTMRCSCEPGQNNIPCKHFRCREADGILACAVFVHCAAAVPSPRASRTYP